MNSDRRFCFNASDKVSDSLAFIGLDSRIS